MRFLVAQRYAGSPVTLLAGSCNTRQQTQNRDYDEIITRNTLLSPDAGIEEVFKHRSIDLGARAFVFVPLFGNEFVANARSTKF